MVFTGFVNEEVKIGALDASTALVLPSVNNYVETFSLAITEARARGKPIITTTVGEIPYRIEHMTNGILLPPRNPRALAEAITLLTNNRELDKKLDTAGRKNVRIWDEIEDELIKTYTTK